MLPEGTPLDSPYLFAKIIHRCVGVCFFVPIPIGVGHGVGDAVDAIMAAFERCDLLFCEKRRGFRNGVHDSFRGQTDHLFLSVTGCKLVRLGVEQPHQRVVRPVVKVWPKLAWVKSNDDRSKTPLCLLERSEYLAVVVRVIEEHHIERGLVLAV